MDYNHTFHENKDFLRLTDIYILNYFYDRYCAHTIKKLINDGWNMPPTHYHHIYNWMLWLFSKGKIITKFGHTMFKISLFNGSLWNHLSVVWTDLHLCQTLFNPAWLPLSFCFSQMRLKTETIFVTISDFDWRNGLLFKTWTIPSLGFPPQRAIYWTLCLSMPLNFFKTVVCWSN